LKISAIFAATVLAAAAPAIAQQPGAPQVSRVEAGAYSVDKAHTQVIWTVNHLGVSALWGAIGASGGTLQIDPAKPAAAKVNITFSPAELISTSPAFTKHLQSADFFDVEKFPTITFTSTAVQVSGTSAKITGNLTVKGITKPVTVDAKFYGAGPNPMSKKLNIGFSGKAHIKRSDFGIGYGGPAVADDLELNITAAFEKG
jgi:polyisoprenoid-binding protein YceI